MPIAKIAGIKLCQAYRRQYGCNFISAMPTNLYGPNDNFDLTASHVLPALIRKFHDAKVERRGVGADLGKRARRRREFLHVDDLADACLFLMREYDDAGHINIGTGEDITIESSPKWCEQLSTRPPRSTSIRQSPTARRKSFSTSPSSIGSAGITKSRFRRVWRQRTSGSSTMKSKRVFGGRKWMPRLC